MSNNVLNLSEEDFFIAQDNKGKKLVTQVPGISFVLFHANAGMCPNCDNVVPQFKALSRNELMTGCRFLLCNLSRNPQLIAMASKTIAPFEYVPYMMLYYDGRPIARYDNDDGEFDINDCAEFLQEMIKRLQSKKNFIQSKNLRFDDDVKKYGGIPFNIFCDEDKGICYIEAESLYGKRNGNR
jgi:hypothetical protein